MVFTAPSPNTSRSTAESLAAPCSRPVARLRSRCCTRSRVRESRSASSSSRASRAPHSRCTMMSSSVTAVYLRCRVACAAAAFHRVTTSWRRRRFTCSTTLACDSRRLRTNSSRSYRLVWAFSAKSRILPAMARRKGLLCTVRPTADAPCTSFPVTASSDSSSTTAARNSVSSRNVREPSGPRAHFTALLLDPSTTLLPAGSREADGAMCRVVLA